MCGPTIIDNLETQAYSLEGILTQQTAAMVGTLAADCAPMDGKASCASVGGRMTTVHDDASGAAVVLTGAYQLSPHLRLGLTLDQVVKNESAAGTVADNGAPMVGLFGVWAQNADGTGFAARVAAAYGQTDVTVESYSINNGPSPFVPGTGIGTADLTSQGASAVISYTSRVSPAVLLTYYAGIQRTDLNRAGYTEVATSDAPLPYTYDAVDDVATTALLGMGLTGELSPHFTLGFRAGLEYDLDRDTDALSATNQNTEDLSPYNDVGDAATFALNANPLKTRASATITGVYTLPNTHRLGFSVGHRQEAFRDIDSTTGKITYAAGF